MTEKQKRFVNEYLIDLNATQAAIRAGYSPKTANEQGSQLLAKLSVPIAQAMAEQSKRTGINADRVLRELAAMGFADTNDIVRLRMKGADRVKALELLGKRLGLDKPEERTGEEDAPFDLPARLVAPSFQAVYLDILEHGHDEYALDGGRGSTKSSFVSCCILDIMERNPEVNALILRKVGDTLRDSVYAQMLWALEVTGLSDKYECRISPMEIERKSTGQKIFFRGLDKPEKAKGIKPRTGYIGVLWFEELDQFSGDAECRNVQQSALRGGDLAWCFKTWNPPQTASAWVNKEFRSPKPGRLHHHSDYTTVPEKWLGKAFLDEAEYLKVVNPKAYAHEYRGEVTGNGGAVFENLQLRTITQEEREQFDWVYHGIDWGYYPDPWAYNRMHYDSARHILYIFGELTRYKCGNRATCDALLEYGVTMQDYLVCDSAEPKSVADYRDYGMDAHGVNKGSVKGKGSVEYSIKWLQSLSAIVIDPETCPDTATEFSEYEYLRDRNGDIISGYPDQNNHHIDAVRYGMAEVWRRGGE